MHSMGKRTAGNRGLTLAAGLLLAAALAACLPDAPNSTATAPPTTATAPAMPTATPEPIGPTATAKGAELEEDWSAVSPDGQWTLRALSQFPPGGSEYQVMLELSGAGQAELRVVLDELRPMGLGYTLPSPVRWSADRQAFYLTNVEHPDGCSAFVDGSDLLRLDLATGALTELVPPVARSLGLSHDEARLAYLAWGSGDLVLRDIANGVESAHPLGLADGG